MSAEEGERDPLANVIQVFGGARNPQLDAIESGQVADAYREAMLAALEEYIGRVRRGEVESLAIVSVGAPGHFDTHYVSEAAWERPAVTVGMLTILAAEIADYARCGDD